MKEKRPEEINNWLLKAALDCVKDESSLDIDLSACAPIPSAPSDNTLSDVWSTHHETNDKETPLRYQENPCFLAPMQFKLEGSSTILNLKPDPDPSPHAEGAFSQIKAAVYPSTVEESSFLPRSASIEATITENNVPPRIDSNKSLPNTKLKSFPKSERTKQTSGKPAAAVEKQRKPKEPAYRAPIDPLATEKKELFQCKNCNEIFESKESLKAHGKMHKTNRTNEVYTCPICEKTLKVGSMWLHRKIHNESERFSCDICGQKFVQKINLIHHTKAHLGEKPFECSQCQMSFPERSHLIKHQRYHTSTRQYKCEKCGKMYKTERCLKVHNLVHLEKRPFVCGECNKSFISSSKLKQHSNIHTGERPYKCKYCARDFTNFPNWLKHTRRRHKVDHKTGESLETIPSYASKKADKKKIKNTEPTTLNVAEKKTASNFTDIYAMSLNSAEELIMEQALEMEESGYIMSPPSDATLGSPPLLSRYEYMSPAAHEVSDLPLSSFQYYLPSLSPLHNSGSTRSDGGVGQTNDTKTLPSVETLFASTFQRASFNHH